MIRSGRKTKHAKRLRERGSKIAARINIRFGRKKAPRGKMSELKRCHGPNGARVLRSTVGEKSIR